MQHPVLVQLGHGDLRFEVALVDPARLERPSTTTSHPASAASTSPRRYPLRAATLSDTGSVGVNFSAPPPTAACCDSTEAPASSIGRSKRARGAPGWTARSRSNTASSVVVSTRTSGAASAAASAVSATTSATGWPAHRISLRASGSFIRFLPSVTIGRSAAVEDRDDARDLERRTGVDAVDRGMGREGEHGSGVEEAAHPDVGGEPGATRHLRPSVHARDGAADRAAEGVDRARGRQCGPLSGGLRLRTAWAGRAVRAPILAGALGILSRPPSRSPACRRLRAGHERPDHGRRHALARSRLRRARDRHRADRVGEVRPLNKTDSFVAVVEELAGRYVVGADPFDTERLAWAIERLEYGRPGEHGQSALAAFDIASLGPHRPAPGCPGLEAPRRPVPRPCPGLRQRLVPVRLRAARIAELAVGVVARGYRAMKLDPFGAASVRLSAADRRRAIAVVAAVREAVGADVDLMIEMHGRFSPDTAAQVAAALEPFAPRWIEEPVPPENADALARVRRATNLSIATGERIHAIWDAAPFVEGGNVDIIQADLTHFGGFTGMRRLAGWTEAHYLTLAPHNVGGPVATAANVHFAVATRNVDIVEHFNDFADAWVSELVDVAPTVDAADGCFAPPGAPRARPPPGPRRVRSPPADRRPTAAVRRGLAEA